jgi:hypothetical protein
MPRILRANQVRVDGVAKISNPIADKQADEAAVRLVQSTDKCSILEITCTCGKRLLIRCEHVSREQ